MHKLQDILCNFPGYCEDRWDMDTAAAQGVDITVALRALKANLISDFRDLIRWRWQWDFDNPNIVQEKEIDASTGLGIDSVGPLFESIIHFQSLELATELVLYSATLLLIGHFYRAITGTEIMGPAMSIWPASERPQPTNPLKLPSETLQEEDMVLEICRSVEYHLQGSHASSGAFALMFPLRVW